MTQTAADAFDAIDYRIMQELTGDGRISDVMLGERVGLSSTAAARRRKILEEQGAITGYTANLNMPKLGLGVTVVVSVALQTQTEDALIAFEAAVRACPSVSYCCFISGDTDFLMLVHVASFEDYDRIYRAELAHLPYVARISSSFVMRSVSQRLVPEALFPQ